jgi:hypothetical protein
VPLEETIAHCDILDANGSLAGLKVYDPINEKKRIAVRDNELDLKRIERCRRRIIGHDANPPRRQLAVRIFVPWLD